MRYLVIEFTPAVKKKDELLLLSADIPDFHEPAGFVVQPNLQPRRADSEQLTSLAALLSTMQHSKKVSDFLWTPQQAKRVQGQKSIRAVKVQNSSPSAVTVGLQEICEKY